MGCPWDFRRRANGAGSVSHASRWRFRLRFLLPKSMIAMAVVCTACAPEVPRSLESGFDMAKHSMSFENFANGYPDALLDEASMQRMFGDSVCLDTGATTPCVLTAGATAWMKRANGAMAGGRCEGFAVLSSLFAQGNRDPVEFGGLDARALALRGNTPLQRELAYWFATQLVPEVNTSAVALEAKDAMPFLAKALAPGAPERFRLGLVKKVGNRLSGGHAVTPFGYFADQKVAGVYWLRVYDNNNPDTERLLKLDTRANRWEFEAARDAKQKSSLYFGDASNGNRLYFSPINVRQGTLPCSFCRGGSGLTVTTGGGVEASVSSGGNSAGVQDGNFSGTGGSATPSFSADLDSEETSLVLHLDSAGDAIAIQLKGPAPAEDQLTGAVTQSLEAFGPGFAMGVTGLKLDPATDDTVAVTGGGSSVRYDNASRTPLTLSSQIDLMNGKSLELVVSTNGSDVIDTFIDPMTGAIKVGATGTSGDQVTVAITQTNGDGTTQQGQFTFEGSDAGTLDVTTQGWMPDAGLTATVDTGGGPVVLTDSCTDGLRNGMESDVDCGQACASKCALAQGCAVAADCASSICGVGGSCVDDLCADGRSSGDESDVDCGGTACRVCTVGRACGLDADCLSGACRMGSCVATWAIGFSVSGLPAGNSLELLNAGEAMTVSADASYVFPTRSTGPYAVTVATQPLQAVCTVANGTGTATAEVGDITVTCSRRFSIGGSLTGLANSASVVLQNNGQDDLTLTVDTPFTFPALVGGAYAVTVLSQPMSQICTVTGGTGTATADVTTVQVSCASGFSLGGTVSGLGGGEQVALRNGGDLLTVTTNGPFTFGQPVNAYAVQIVTPPAGKTCVVVNASGAAVANVTNVGVLCAPSGSLDTSFNGTGFFTTSTSPTVDYLVDLALNADGSMVAVGQTEVTAGADNDWVVLKLRADGTADSTFGTAGVVTLSAGVGFESARAIFPDAGGYLVLGTLSGTNADLGIARLNSNGTLDMTFGNNGVMRHDHGQWEYFVDVARDPMGRFVVVGRRSASGAGPHDVVVARLNTNGTLDVLFGAMGFVDFDAGGDESATAVAIDPTTSAIYVAASANGSDTIVLRLDVGGALEPLFGTSGVVTVDLSGAGRDEFAFDLLSLGGDVYVAGRADGPTNSELAVARLAGSNGALQPAFGTGGRVVIDRGASEFAFALAPAPQGGLYVGGFSGPRMLVGRLTAAGAVDATFATSGFFEGALSNSATASRLVVDASGRVLVAGTIWGTGTEDLGVVRLQP